jgi:hypothetical protein
MKALLVCVLLATALAKPTETIVEKVEIKEEIPANWYNNWWPANQANGQYYNRQYYNNNQYYKNPEWYNYKPEVIEKVRPITKIVYDPIRQPLQVQQQIDPMMFLLLANDDDSSNSDLLPLMMMMGNNGMDGQNPLLWMTLLDDDKTCLEQYPAITDDALAAPTVEADALADEFHYEYVFCKEQAAEETGLFGDNAWLLLPFLNGQQGGGMDPLMMMLMLNKDGSGSSNDMLPLLMMQNGFTNPTSADQPNPLLWMVLLQEEACAIKYKIPNHYWDLLTVPGDATKVTAAADVKAHYEAEVTGYADCNANEGDDNDFLLPFLMMNQGGFGNGFGQQGGMDPMMMMLLMRD